VVVIVSMLVQLDTVYVKLEGSRSKLKVQGHRRKTLLFQTGQECKIRTLR